MTQVDELLAYRKDREEMVKLGDALERLRKNRDFKTIIETAFFQNEAVRLVQASGNVRLSETERDFVMKDIYAISSFGQFLTSIAQAAHMAKEQIPQIDEAIASLNIDDEFVPSMVAGE